MDKPHPERLFNLDRVYNPVWQNNLAVSEMKVFYGENRTIPEAEYKKKILRLARDIQTQAIWNLHLLTQEIREAETTL